MKTFTGELSRKNESWDDARKELTITIAKYETPESINSHIGKPSAYLSRFDKGADIYPRGLWFVKIAKHELLGISQDKPHVETDDSLQTKPPWDKINITGTIERKFIFSTVLGEDLVPFGTLHYKPIVLPILTTPKGIIIIDGPNRATSLGYPGLAEYLRNVEEVWKNLAKTKKLGLYQWIDFRRKLSSQNPSNRFKVLYTGSATHITSAVVDQTSRFTIPLDGTAFQLGSFIAESKVYYTETNNKEEAYYLSAVLNSNIVDEAIKPTQTRGLFGARDIHKRPLKLPIPVFDSGQHAHTKLAALGQEAEQIVAEGKSSLERYKSIGKIRSSLRTLLHDQLSQIDEVVGSILT
jgi:hypothetical protein